MRPTFVTPAIVLHNWRYGESDKIVCLLTRDYGKVTGIAKGAVKSRRRFANSLDVFSLINLRFHDRPHGGLVFILSADLMFPFRHIVTSLEKISLASYLVEITAALIGERDRCTGIFEHLKNGLMFVNDKATAPLYFLTSYELKLLKLAGYQPALERCKSCANGWGERTITKWYVIPAEGGILCERCVRPGKETRPLGTDVLEVLVELQREDSRLKSSKPLAEFREVRLILQCFLREHLNREIKSAAFVSKFVEV